MSIQVTFYAKEEFGLEITKTLKLKFGLEESNLQHTQLSDACEILELNVLGAL